MSNRKALPFYNEFTHLQEDTLGLDHFDPTSRFFPLEKADSPTNVNGEAQVDDELISSSLKLGQRDYEISFEETLSDQTQKCFLGKLQNFMESCLKFKNVNGLTLASPEIYQENMEAYSFRNFQSLLMDMKVKSEGEKLLAKEKELEKFFKFLSAEVPEKILRELFFLASVAYIQRQQKLSKKQCFDDEYEIIEWVRAYLKQNFEAIYFDEKVSYLSMRAANQDELNSEQMIKQAFKEFTEFFLSSIILLLEGYFTNPFSEQEDGRRGRRIESLEADENGQSSSTESVEMGIPRKRFH